MSGCGPCHALIEKQMPAHLQRAATYNGFSFAHYNKDNGKLERQMGLYLSNDYMQHIKQTTSYPEVCLVVLGLSGSPTKIIPFTGGSEIERVECWLRTRTRTQTWNPNFRCPS